MHGLPVVIYYSFNWFQLQNNNLKIIKRKGIDIYQEGDNIFEEMKARQNLNCKTRKIPLVEINYVIFVFWRKITKFQFLGSSLLNFCQFSFSFSFHFAYFLSLCYFFQHYEDHFRFIFYLPFLNTILNYCLFSFVLFARCFPRLWGGFLPLFRVCFLITSFSFCSYLFVQRGLYCSWSQYHRCRQCQGWFSNLK